MLRLAVCVPHAQAAGLVQLLNDTAMMESLTMLLPSNAAFADFFADMGGVEAEGPELLMSNSIITPVLLYHISEGITPKADFVPGLVSTVLPFQKLAYGGNHSQD